MLVSVNALHRRHLVGIPPRAEITARCRRISAGIAAVLVCCGGGSVAVRIARAAVSARCRTVGGRGRQSLPAANQTRAVVLSLGLGRFLGRRCTGAIEPAQ